MRLVRKDINTREGSGSVTLLPQEPEDMWHLYNLIRPKDTLRAPAIRKVKTTSATGATSSTTVRTQLAIRVASTDFDAGAGELHVAGRVCEENAHVALGAHHTLDLELNRQFALHKDGEDGEGWDSVALAQLKEATDTRRAAHTFAVVMHEGLANICMLTDTQTILRQRVEVAVPRKRGGAGAEAHERGMEKFFDTTLTTLLRHLDLPTLTAEGKNPPLLLASPGFVAAEFQRFILDRATRSNDKALLGYARAAIVVAHSSTGHVHALAEVLKEPNVQAKLSDTKFARETALVERFFELVRKDDGRAWYGPREVERAVEKGAVGRGGGVLLISNKLFRALDVGKRRHWVALVERVRDVEGGEVRVLSSAHESGKRLEGLGDVGAILTFPLLDLDEEEEEEEAPVDGDYPDAAVAGNVNGDAAVNGQNHDRLHGNADF